MSRAFINTHCYRNTIEIDISYVFRPSSPTYTSRSAIQTSIHIYIPGTLRTSVSSSSISYSFLTLSQHLLAKSSITMADVIFAIPADRNLQDLGALTAQEIRFELTQRGIAFDPKGLKADLLPVLALLRLGVVDKYRAADPALLAKVSRWCASLVPVLEATLRNLVIEKGANRWFDIENLIRAEFVLLLLRLSFSFN